MGGVGLGGLPLAFSFCFSVRVRGKCFLLSLSHARLRLLWALFEPVGVL